MTMKVDHLEWRCPWCGKYYKTPRLSGWEQQNVTTKQWREMCNRCATRRLNNPYNALFGMRRIGHARQTKEGTP